MQTATYMRWCCFRRKLIVFFVLYHPFCIKFHVFTKKKLYFLHLEKVLSVLHCFRSSLLQLRNWLGTLGSLQPRQLLVHHRIPMKKMYALLLFSHCHAFLHLMKRMSEGEEKPVQSAFKLIKQEEQSSSHMHYHPP